LGGREGKGKLSEFKEKWGNRHTRLPGGRGGKHGRMESRKRGNRKTQTAQEGNFDYMAWYRSKKRRPPPHPPRREEVLA